MTEPAAIDTRAEIVMLTPAELDARVGQAVEAETAALGRRLDTLESVGSSVAILLALLMCYVYWRSQPATLARMERGLRAERKLAEVRHAEVMTAHDEFLVTIRRHTAHAADKLVAMEVEFDRRLAALERAA